MSCGFASNLRDALPNASFIGCTGTPIEKTDANTRTVVQMSNDEFGVSNFASRTFNGHILEQEDGKKHCVQVVSELSQAFTL